MKSILLIGLGRFGKFIAMKLHSMGHQVMAVDTNEDSEYCTSLCDQCTDRRQYKRGISGFFGHQQL